MIYRFAARKAKVQLEYVYSVPHNKYLSERGHFSIDCDAQINQ